MPGDRNRLGAVQKVARSIVREKDVMHLSDRDSAYFAEALLNPPEPSNKLRASARRYKQQINEKGE